MTFAPGAGGQNEIVIRITAQDDTSEAWDRIRQRWGSGGGGGSGASGGGAGGRGGPIPPISITANTSAFDQALARTQQQLARVSNQAHRVQVQLVDQVSQRLDQINRGINRLVSAPFRFVLSAQDNLSSTLRRLRRISRYITTIRRLSNLVADPFKAMVNAAR